MPPKGQLAVDPIEEVRRQWRRRGLPAPDAVRAVGSVMRAQQVLLYRLEELLAPLGLSFARYEALLLLHFSQHGSLPLSRMGERLLVHPTAVTHTVDRLERQELVRRMPHPTDRRTTLAEITEKGRAVAEEAMAALAAESFGLAGWKTPDLRTLNALMKRIRREQGDFVEDEEVRTTASAM
jgi:DNA-binding MarR family transcriptional regulator